jgi:hypothetical protein
VTKVIIGTSVLIGVKGANDKIEKSVDSGSRLGWWAFGGIVLAAVGAAWYGLK